MNTRIPIPKPLKALINNGALLAVNHSGGKDSQAMTSLILDAGISRDQLVIVHADLGRVEWPGTFDHIKATTFGLPIIVAEAKRDFFEMVKARKMFPSPKYRQCTSDLKRGPIERELRRYLKANPRFQGQIINAMGMRADESRDRAKRTPLTFSKRNSKAGRVWFDWLPIHALTTRDVFEVISNAGQVPHWAYGAGMSRVSCSFCIMSSRADLCRAATLRPRLFEDYAALEHQLGHTLSPNREYLSDIVSCAG